MSHFQRKLGGLGQIYCRVEARKAEHLSLEIDAIPDDFSLTKIQKFYVDGQKSKKVAVDKKVLQQFLAELEYPLYFFRLRDSGGGGPSLE